MSIVGARRRPPRAPMDALVDRVQGLSRFVRLTEPYLPAPRIAAARALVDRAGERLALSRAHTVVALAGATGSGKSSLFNALAGEGLSPVSVRRPTTGDAHACVWGPEKAHELLDWLRVGHRYGRDAAGADEALAGLVLVDLPDFDSVATEHRVESDRLLALADLIVWVLDPQKYADRVLHRQYLANFGHHRAITVVVLNQADRLSDEELQTCLTDLRALLEADGLAGAPVLATSAVASPGVGVLRRVLERTVAARMAALQRLGGDVAATVADLQPIVSRPLERGEDRAIADGLYAALASAAGVPLVASAVERSYVHRAVRHTGWPPTRWLRRFRADPLWRLRVGRSRASPSEPVAATSIGPAAPAASAAVALALRSVGDRYGRGLAEPWPQALLDAARSRAADLPDALDVAVAKTDVEMARPPLWWRLVGALHWLLVAAAGVGLAWLVLRYALFALALPEPPAPRVGRLSLFTLVLVGGGLGGLLLAIIVRPVVTAAARRRRRRVTARLTDAVRRVGDELVLTPVLRAAHEYTEARSALGVAAE
jgi:GTP-binding protein EngB required for normal cell division